MGQGPHLGTLMSIASCWLRYDCVLLRGPVRHWAAQDEEGCISWQLAVPRSRAGGRLCKTPCCPDLGWTYLWALETHGLKPEMEVGGGCMPSPESSVEPPGSLKGTGTTHKKTDG